MPSELKVVFRRDLLPISQHVNSDLMFISWIRWRIFDHVSDLPHHTPVVHYTELINGQAMVGCHISGLFPCNIEITCNVHTIFLFTIEPK